MTITKQDPNNSGSRTQWMQAELLAPTRSQWIQQQTSFNDPSTTSTTRTISHNQANDLSLQQQAILAQQHDAAVNALNIEPQQVRMVGTDGSVSRIMNVHPITGDLSLARGGNTPVYVDQRGAFIDTTQVAPAQQGTSY